MRFLVQISVSLCVLQAFTNGGEIHLQPEQIHLSLGVDPSQMGVTWLTVDKTTTPQVRYGLAGNGPPKFGKIENGYSTLYVDGGTEQRKMYIHRAFMTGLIPGAVYYYHVGSTDGWSTMFWFRAQRNDSNFAPTLAVYGDLGESFTRYIFDGGCRRDGTGSSSTIIHQPSKSLKLCEGFDSSLQATLTATPSHFSKTKRREEQSTQSCMSEISRTI